MAIPDLEITRQVASTSRASTSKQSFRTTGSQGPDEDEIASAGFTLEEGRAVRAPCVAECPVALECRLIWHRPLLDGSRWHLSSSRARRSSTRILPSG